MLVPILLNGGFGYENLRFSIPVAVATQGRWWRYRRFEPLSPVCQRRLEVNSRCLTGGNSSSTSCKIPFRAAVGWAEDA